MTQTPSGSRLALVDRGRRAETLRIASGLAGLALAVSSGAALSSIATAGRFGRPHQPLLLPTGGGGRHHSMAQRQSRRRSPSGLGYEVRT